MPEIKTILNEPKRGCGFRKAGGLYMISEGLSTPCERLPFPLVVCPVCHGGIKPTRGFTWIDARTITEEIRKDRPCASPTCAYCPINDPPDRAGLIWIGGSHYNTPADFLSEAVDQGVCRKIGAVPRDFEIGETWVFLAHRKAISNAQEIVSYPIPADGPCTGEEEIEFTPGIIRAFRPSRIEYAVKGTETTEELDRMESRGLSPVRLKRTDEADLTLNLQNGQSAFDRLRRAVETFRGRH